MAELLNKNIGRMEKITSGDTTYVCIHWDYEAADADTDWDLMRIVTSGSNRSFKKKKGSFSTYDTEDWGD